MSAGDAYLLRRNYRLFRWPDNEYHTDWLSAVNSQDPNFFYPEISDHEPVRLRGHVVRDAQPYDPLLRLDRAIDDLKCWQMSRIDRAAYLKVLDELAVKRR